MKNFGLAIFFLGVATERLFDVANANCTKGS